jgi:hypothetical protein
LLGHLASLGFEVSEVPSGTEAEGRRTRAARTSQPSSSFNVREVHWEGDTVTGPTHSFKVMPSDEMKHQFIIAIFSAFVGFYLRFRTLKKLSMHGYSQG